MNNHYRFERGSRYYEIFTLQNLFGENDLVTVNGRIGSKLGRVRVQPLKHQSTEHLINTIIHRRIKRGYISI